MYTRLIIMLLQKLFINLSLSKILCSVPYIYFEEFYYVIENINVSISL